MDCAVNGCLEARSTDAAQSTNSGNCNFVLTTGSDAKAAPFKRHGKMMKIMHQDLVAKPRSGITVNVVDEA